MKKLTQHLIQLLSFTLLNIILIVSASAHEANGSKVVMHISDYKKLQMLVNNVSNLRKASGKKTEITIVVNGPAVTRFVKLANTDKQVQTILKNNAEISVCSIAMKNKNVLKSQLMDGITYLEKGGVATLIDLQRQGYFYLKI